MEERLIIKNARYEDIITRVNELVKDELPVNDIHDKTSSLEKWTSITCLLALKDDKKDRVLSFIEYVDSSTVSLKQKALIVTSLACLIEYGKINIDDYDINDLFLITEFYANKSIQTVLDTIKVIGNKDLLLAIRKKTLDNDSRKKIISVVEKSIINDKIDSTDLNLVDKFISDKIKEIEDTNY